MTPNVITFTLAQKERAKLFLITLLSLVIGIGGMYLAGAVKFGGGRFLLLTLAVFAILVAIFCLTSIFYLSKEKGVGMHISDDGVYDISTGNSYGTVLWKDVTDIRIMNDLGNLKRHYIVLKLQNPTEYIQREPSQSKKRTLELKLQYYGSPVCFSDRALNCTFEELKNAVFLKYNQYKEQQSDIECV